MAGDGEVKKRFKKQTAGAKAKKKNVKVERHNPKAFSFSGGSLSVRRRVQHSAEIAEKREKVELIVDKTPTAAPPPIICVVQGPPGSGKSTLIRSLVKHYTRENISRVSGPITCVVSKGRRYTFVECPTDMNAMLDLAKVADLVITLIDSEKGLEMDTFEFINILQQHGMPRIIGVLTKIDKFKDSKALKTFKRTTKHRFWTEIYDGAKLFHLTGIKGKKYFKREILNLARFVSVQKYAPLKWRSLHPYFLPLTIELEGGHEVGSSSASSAFSSTANQEDLCSVSLAGYIKGSRLMPNTHSLHIPGLGDYPVTSYSLLADPCPLPERSAEKAASKDSNKLLRKLKQKEKLLFAPGCDVGSLSVEGATFSVNFAAKRTPRFTPGLRAEAEAEAEMARREGEEGEGEGGGKGKTGGEGTAGTESASESDDGWDTSDGSDSDDSQDDSDSDLDHDKENGEGEDGEREEKDDEEESEVESQRKGRGRGRRDAVKMVRDLQRGRGALDKQIGQSSVGLFDGAMAPSDEEVDAQGGAESQRADYRLLKGMGFDELDEEESRARNRAFEFGGVDDDDDEELKGEGGGGRVGRERGADGKDGPSALERALLELESRSVTQASKSQQLKEYVYGKEGEEDKAAKAATEDIFPWDTGVWEESKGEAIEARADTMLVDEEFLFKNLRNLAPTIRQSENSQKRSSSDEKDSDSKSASDSDSDSDADSESDSDSGSMEDRTENDTENDTSIDHDNDNGNEKQDGDEEVIVKTSRLASLFTKKMLKGLRGAFFMTGGWDSGISAEEEAVLELPATLEEYEKQRFAKRLESLKLGAEEKKAAEAELRALDSASGDIPIGAFIRVTLSNVPRDWLAGVLGEATNTHTEVSESQSQAQSKVGIWKPVIVGGVIPTETALSFIHARVKRHRWNPKILKSVEPLTFSVGWRRFQSLPYFFMEERNAVRRRLLKYTPEHMHCEAYFFAHAAPPGSGVVAIKHSDKLLSDFRVSMTGVVMGNEPSPKLLKKLKLIGQPGVIKQNTAFIKGMFNSDLEVSMATNVAIQTQSGVRGVIKKAVGTDGEFRAAFEARIRPNDIVICKTWYRMQLETFINPVLDLPQYERLRTIAEIRRAAALAPYSKKASEYKQKEKVPAFKPGQLRLPAKTVAALPYSSIPKDLPAKRSQSAREEAKKKEAKPKMDAHDKQLSSLLHKATVLKAKRLRNLKTKEIERKEARDKEGARISEIKRASAKDKISQAHYKKGMDQKRLRKRLRLEE